MNRSPLPHLLGAAACSALVVSALFLGPALHRDTFAHQATPTPAHQGTAAPAGHGTKMDPEAKTITIEGAVRDLACPVQNPVGDTAAELRLSTRFSLKCTLDCVKGGSPIIIVTKDGLIYFPISADMPDSSQNEKMMPFVGKYVQATGPAFDRRGTHAIAITQIKELKSVHIDTSAE